MICDMTSTETERVSYAHGSLLRLVACCTNTAKKKKNQKEKDMILLLLLSETTAACCVQCNEARASSIVSKS